MPLASSALRQQIEAALANRIPSALSPVPRVLRPLAGIGIASIDELLAGGLPLGAITELVGPECSGRTSLALSFVSRMTQAGKVCAWIDVSNMLKPESAAAVGMDLSRLLWVRCGVVPRQPQPTSSNTFALPKKYLIPPPITKGLHGGGFGPHPRDEVKGLSDAVSVFLKPELKAAHRPELQYEIKSERAAIEQMLALPQLHNRKSISSKPWARIEQALRVTDLLLQGGGFSAIVFDMGSIAPESALRVPSATWFRYRAAAERSQAAILLLTQHACAKSSAGLVLRLQAGNVLRDTPTVFTGIEYRVEVERERFQPASSNVMPLRKPPQRVTDARWQSRTPWAGRGKR
jgi:recombination protein RecA